jgi:hypothetical protein
MHKTLVEHALPCASPHQAQDVIDRLFGKRLILRAEILPIQKGIDQVIVVMENLEEDVAAIASELQAFFGHDKFDLRPLPR